MKVAYKKGCLLSIGNLRFHWILILDQAGNKNTYHIYKVMTAFQKTCIQKKSINWLGKEGSINTYLYSTRSS